MALDKVISALQRAALRLPTRSVADLATRTARLTDGLRRSARGSSHPHILAAIAAAHRAQQHLAAALEHLSRSREHLSSYAARINGSSIESGSSPTPAPAGAWWSPPETLPRHVAEAGSTFLPRPEGANRPTSGIYAGNQVESGGRDKSVAADLISDPLRGPPVTFYQHVESKVAAMMRRDGTAKGDLVLDNTVCGSNQRDQDHEWSCDKILPSIIPAGSELTVYTTRDQGKTWWKRTYVGTGERIIR
ncbi:DddA-like double-stranded DNA deaminase toxin [Micromonospora sp. Llam0]|uniref:DddA-like double-stranded DNA deaminase toxin n=1 Tax=Micromonospora sp. Llam0 TaxID=2485143 RepID=UPI000F4A6C57|nr:DddA-like double-stranded DNA deaminase toxin [Micromonospora sp. Llam0]